MPLTPASKDRIGLQISRLRKLARKLVPARDVDDVVQEALLRLDRTPTDLTAFTSQAYAKKVIRNLIIDRTRHAQARGGVALSFDELDDSFAPSANPDQETSLLLKQIILGLPPLYRDTFILNRFVGLTYDQIAQRYGITTKAVEYRMSRALALCQEALRA